MSENGDRAKQLLRGARFGVLSTLQQARKPGWPMVSLAPYALSAGGEPVLAMSAIAQHTKNLIADDRACLYVQQPGGGDPQQDARVAALGRVRRARTDEVAELKARYLAAHPEAEPFFELDFGLYVLAIEDVRFIGGFGAAAWVAVGEVVGGA